MGIPTVPARLLFFFSFTLVFFVFFFFFVVFYFGLCSLKRWLSLTRYTKEFSQDTKLL